MKIRIKGNTLRMRLSQSELQQLASQGQVSETITFGPDQSLVYTLQRSAGVAHLTASYTAGQILVTLPDAAAMHWIAGDEQVSIPADWDNGTQEALSLLIEKDFRCLTERLQEDESDLFPHPKEGRIKC